MSEETCEICGNAVKTQIMKNTGVCGENCRKLRAGETSRPAAQTDAGITNLIAKPEGIDPRGIV